MLFRICLGNLMKLRPLLNHTIYLGLGTHNKRNRLNISTHTALGVGFKISKQLTVNLIRQILLILIQGIRQLFKIT